jgi:hypothetical protein
MYGKKVVEPEPTWFQNLRGMDFWFIAILGVIVFATVIVVMMRK